MYLQELDFIIYTRGGGLWYFRPRSRGGLTNFTPIAGMGHLISKTKFKIPPPLPPANFWQVPKGVHIANFEVDLCSSTVNYCSISNANNYQCSCKQCCAIAVYAMCYSVINPWVVVPVPKFADFVFGTQVGSHGHPLPTWKQTLHIAATRTTT